MEDRSKYKYINVLMFFLLKLLFYRFGFATEHSPRCIIRTCCEVDGVLIPDIYKYKDQQKLTLALSNFIHTLFYK